MNTVEQTKSVIYYADDLRGCRPLPPALPGQSELQRAPLTDSVQIRRKIKSNLNKLTVEKFVPIAERIAQLLETCCRDQISEFTDLIVDTALAEHALSEMYCDLLAVSCLWPRLNERWLRCSVSAAFIIP